MLRKFTTKEGVLVLYIAFGGVAIQNRIAASFFLWRKLRFIQSFACEKARSPPLRFDFKKIQIGGKDMEGKQPKRRKDKYNPSSGWKILCVPE